MNATLKLINPVPTMKPRFGIKQLPEAKTGHEQTMIQRQIDATDRRIDKLVYELYELTPEEITIVEGE